MRKLPILLVVAFALSVPAHAEDKPPPDDASYKGIWMSTAYPALTVSASEPVTIDLEMHNEGLPPERVALDVVDLPKGWRATFLGGGRPIDAVFVSPDATTDFKLRVEPPAEVESGTYRFQLAAKGEEEAAQSALMLALTLGQVLPQRLTLVPELPALRASAGTTFDFRVTVENQSGEDALVHLEAQAPRNFEVSFTESYGSQQLTSIPVEAGASKDVSVKIEPPHNVAAGTYAVGVRAAAKGAEADTKLTLDITGQPELSVTGPQGLVSGSAYAGEEASLPLTIRNTGSAPAESVQLSSTEPSGWKIGFEPATIERLPPGGEIAVKALVTPSSKALAGDYMVTLSADASGASKSEDFRIAVQTSTLWGIVGVVVIAAALVVVGLAVLRFGRR